MTGPSAPLRIGIVGCGNIAGPYARDIASKPGVLELVAATDLDRSRAVALTSAHGGVAVDDLGALLNLDIDAVVNLTFQGEHARVTRAALEAGKHVHSEKPLAMSSAEAWGLVELARERRLRLSASPFTLMNEAQQTAWRVVREGWLGPVRAVLAEVDWGRIETWHPAPQPFYEVGPLSDVGVYPITIITSVLGPVRRVRAFGRVLAPDRMTRDGTPFRITTPDLQIVILELEGGAVARLTASFYLGQQAQGFASVAFHGDEGSVTVDHHSHADASVEFARLSDKEHHERVPPAREAEQQMDWARVLVDVAEAIRDERPHRATGAQAAHLVDILDAARTSMASDGAPVDVTSSFPAPQPMPWALTDAEMTPAART